MGAYLKKYEGVRGGRSRQKRATLILAMRQQRPMKYLLSIASDAMIKQEIRRWKRFFLFYRGGEQYTLSKRPPPPNLIRRELEKALAESEGKTDDFSRGRADLARNLLNRFYYKG